MASAETIAAPGDGRGGTARAARLRVLALNVGHFQTHFFLLIYPTVVLTLERELGADYGALLLPSTLAFAMLALGALPAGWLGDRWSRRGSMLLLFAGLALGGLATGLAEGPLGLAFGLGLIGLAASIYHPVGIAMLVEQAKPLGRALGVNGVWGNMGVAAAPLAAAVLAEGLGWRWAFLIPAAIAAMSGLAFALLPAAPERAEDPAAQASDAEAPLDRTARLRVLLYLLVAMVLSGLVFDGTTITLPKLMEERLGEALPGGIAAGGLASLIFALAALAQIVVGHLLDRVSARPVAALVPLLQAPALLLAVWLSGWAAFPAALLVMALVFGQIPIGDALLARASSRALRARLYALKYLLGAGVGAAGVPIIAWLHGPEQGLAPLYVLLAALAVGTAAAAVLLPPPPHRD